MCTVHVYWSYSSSILVYTSYEKLCTVFYKSVPCLYDSLKFLSPEALNDASWSFCGSLLAIRRAFCNRIRISRKLSHKPEKCKNLSVPVHCITNMLIKCKFILNALYKVV